MNTQLIVDTSSQYEMDIYIKRSQALVKGEGVWIWDSDDNRYLDCHTGIGVAALGHSHPGLVAAISRQARQLITVQGAFHHEVRSEVAEKLASIAPGSLSRSYFANGGAEAVETALKVARSSTRRSNIIAATRGFHGRSLGALSATFRKRFKEPFMPLLPGFSFVPYNKIETLEQAVDHETAAFIVEIVQGEGGIHVADAEYLAAAREICTKNGALLIIDEVQTGFGRTGRMFACDHFNLEPDMMVVGKGMGGGMPVSALITTNDVIAPTGNHGCTFGGNALAMAAVLKTIDIMEEEKLPQNSVEMGNYLISLLTDANLQVVKEIRGLGLMIGIELKTHVKKYFPQFESNGLLLAAAGPRILRLLPPLIITKEEVEQVAKIVVDVLSKG